jgi:hypothetical protein
MIDGRTYITAEQMCHDSYTEALGREARPDELVYWKAFMVNNPCNPSAMVHWHMDWLRSKGGAGAAELPLMIERSYRAVMHRSPKPDETHYWESEVHNDVPTASDSDQAYTQENHTYRKLCQYHQDWLNAGNLP